MFISMQFPSRNMFSVVMMMRVMMMRMFVKMIAFIRMDFAWVLKIFKIHDMSIWAESPGCGQILNSNLLVGVISMMMMSRLWSQTEVV